MNKLKISSTLNLHHYTKDDFLSYVRSGLEFMQNVGFDAADFPMRFLPKSIPDIAKYAEDIKQIERKANIRFEVCHLPYSTSICTHPELLPTFNDSVHRSIDLAHYLGIKYAVLHPNTVSVPEDEFDRTKSYDSVMSHLAPFVEHASKVGVNLAVENMRVVYEKYPTHRYCQTPDELCDIADALGIGVCWDFGHANISKVNQKEGIRYVGNRLKVIHVNDNTGYDDDHILPFTGNINWNEAIEALSDVGFTGLFNYEINTNRVPSSLRKSFAEYLVCAANEMLTYYN